MRDLHAEKRGITHRLYLSRTFNPLPQTPSVRHTVVGNNLLRGVSGGEKKRVTLGEMMVTRGNLIFFDSYTKVSQKEATY